MKDKILIFDKLDKQYWIKNVNSVCCSFHEPAIDDASVTVRLEGNITVDGFTAVHMVLFACLMDHFIELGYNVYLNSPDTRFRDLFFEDIKLQFYFNSEKKESHVEAEDQTILNLWKVVNKEADFYSRSVAGYFQKNYFNGCDLTSFSLSLYEIYQNVADHSQSNGRAYSYINYDDKKRIIHVATCDLGLGIPTTLKMAGKQYTSDSHALRESIEYGITSNSQPHNKGFGLDNVISSLANNDILRIVSNRALMLCPADKTNIKLFSLDFDFSGTLLYFDVSVDSFMQEETLFNTGLDFEQW